MKKIIVYLVSFSILLISLVSCKKNEKVETNVSYDEVKEAEVIIVGAGAAGLSSAISASKNGAKDIIIIEQTNRTGGNLNLTSGSMSAANTSIQKECGINDSTQSYEDDIFKNGANLGDKKLIKTYVENATNTFEWLLENGLKEKSFSVDKKGCKAVLAPEHQLYSIPRTYKVKASNKDKYHSATHEVLDEQVKKINGIKIDFETEALKLIPNEKGQVLSVIAKNKEGKQILYKSKKGIIMATGGYSGNLKIIEKYAKQGKGYLSSTSSLGKGLRMMQEVGAKIDEEKMSYIPTFPMGVQTGKNSGTIGSTYTWKTGGICVNKNGERFVNEQESRVDVREVALEKQEDAIQYDIFTDKIVEDLVKFKANFMYDLYFGEKGIAKNLVKEATSLEELAEKINVPKDNLLKTVKEYNNSVEEGKADKFGRSYNKQEVGKNPYNLAINKIEGSKYYAIPLKALVVMTLGGVNIDEQSRVLDENNQVIPGLYAAGESTGGIWGKFVSGGTGVMGPITFGFIAGKSIMENKLEENYEIKVAKNIFDEKLFEKTVTSDKKIDMNSKFKDGEYEASVDGQNGKLKLKTTIKENKITEIKIIEQNETKEISEAALNEIPKNIIAKNSLDVELISGATLTSNRIIDAVYDCLKQAQVK